jgi:hypothetical protein
MSKLKKAQAEQVTGTGCDSRVPSKRELADPNYPQPTAAQYEDEQREVEAEWDGEPA